MTSPVLVDRPPEILTKTANGHEEFVQMPDVADQPGPMPKPPRVREAEGFAPVPDGFVRDGDAAGARRSSTSRKLRVKR